MPIFLVNICKQSFIKKSIITPTMAQGLSLQVQICFEEMNFY